MAGAPPVSTAITARSASTSTPATRPTALRSPANTTVVSSPRMLWALVATSPSASTTPDPRPRPRPIPTTDGPTRSATCRTVCSSSSSTLMRRSSLASNLLIASY